MRHSTTRKHTVRRHRRPLRGHGFFGNLFNKGKALVQKLKDTQAISKIANGALSTGLIPGKYSGYVQKAADIAGANGFGRRHHRHVGRPRTSHHRVLIGHGRRHVGRPRTSHHRVLRGHGFKDFLTKANNWLRDKKVISGVAGVLGSAGVPFASSIGNVAGKLGYGRKRRHHSRKIIHPSLLGKGHRRHGSMRGRGLALSQYTSPQSGVGLGGTTVFSSGHVIF